MKNIILILSLLLSFSAIGQDVKEDIKKDFADYNTLIQKMDMEASMEYVIEDIFEYFPKKDMISFLEQTFSDTTVEIKFGEYTVSDFSNEIAIKEETYYFFINNTSIIMKFLPENKLETDQEKTERINALKNAFESSYGPENVIYDKETDFFTLKAAKKVCAKSKNAKSNWKFLNIQENQMKMFRKILPRKVYKKL